MGGFRLAVVAALLLFAGAVLPGAASAGKGGKDCGKRGHKVSDVKAAPKRGGRGKGRCHGKRPRPPGKPAGGSAGTPATPPAGPTAVTSGAGAGQAPTPSGAGAAPTPALPTTDPPPPGVIFVAPSGDDSQAGSSALPVRTIGKALERSRGGERIIVAPGEYPSFRDTRQRLAEVTVEGVGSPTVAGGELRGASHVTLTGLRFTGGVLVDAHPSIDGRVSHHIEIRGSELTSARPLASRCLTIRSGAYEILVEGNEIHHCYTGISGPGYGFSDPSQIPHSNHITIRDNRLEWFKADGIAFGHWRDVVIADNLIAYSKDPAQVIHNDGIQVIGDSARVTIARNVIKHSSGQLMLIQDAVGTNDDVLIRDNLSYRSGTYAWQLGGTTNLRVYNNTVWKSKHGGILLRPGAYASVANNVSDFIGSDFRGQGGAWEYFDYNLMGRTWNTVLPHSTVGVDPGFVDVAADDYRLQEGSPAIGAGNSAFSGATDLAKMPRSVPPSLGALEPGSPPPAG